MLPVVAWESAIVDVVAHLTIELIERYALRELSEVEIQRVEKHVLRCSECQERLQAEIDVTAAMRSSMTAKIGKIVKAEKKRPPQRGRIKTRRTSAGDRCAA